MAEVSQMASRANTPIPSIEFDEKNNFRDRSPDNRILFSQNTVQRERDMSQIHNNYQCCYGNESVDKRLLQLIIQFTVACFILAFCAIKLSGTCDDQNVYLVVMSSILGFYFNTGINIGIEQYTKK